MTCVCGSNRIISISGKCSDLCFVSYNDKDTDGYVPHTIGIGGGDEVEFDYCADCGRIQSNAFPLDDETIYEVLED